MKHFRIAILGDVVARPVPLAIDGAAESLVYVPADRHDPDGFCVSLDSGLILGLDPKSPSGLRLLKGPTEEAEHFRWKPDSQRLIMTQWPREGQPAVLRVFPGASGTLPRAAAK